MLHHFHGALIFKMSLFCFSMEYWIPHVVFIKSTIKNWFTLVANQAFRQSVDNYFMGKLMRLKKKSIPVHQLNSHNDQHQNIVMMPASLHTCKYGMKTSLVQTITCTAFGQHTLLSMEVSKHVYSNHSLNNLWSARWSV